MSLSEELATKYCLVENDGKTPDSYALCAINEALERAAQVAEALEFGNPTPRTIIAKRIRALKDTP